jgi:hypothetical protein
LNESREFINKMSDGWQGGARLPVEDGISWNGANWEAAT